MKAKLSKPVKPTSGVKVTVAVQVPAVQEVSVMALKVPWAGGVTIVKVNGVPSGSEPVSVMVTGVPSAVLTDWRLAVGVSLTPGSRGSGHVRGFLRRQGSGLCHPGDIRYDATSRTTC